MTYKYVNLRCLYGLGPRGYDTSVVCILPGHLGLNPSKGNSTLHPNLIRFKSCQGTSDDEVTIPLAGNLFSGLSEYENLFPWDCRGAPIFGKLPQFNFTVHKIKAIRFFDFCLDP